MSLEAVMRNGHNLSLGVFEECGAYGVARLEAVHLEERVDWTPFNAALSTKDRRERGVHFFIDDYLFQRVWNDPRRYAALLMEYKAVMSPDFSLFTDYPKAVQIYNHYRKHLLAAYWQQIGVTVIPSICWSDIDSFGWCFDGEPVGGTVAVSSVGTQKNPDARKLFLDGYNEMLLRLAPSKIVFFGDVPAECDGNIERINTFHSTLAHARKER